MSLKQVILTSGLVAALGTPLGARQTPPAAPQPAQPQPSDPAKPVGPPPGKAPSSIIPRLKLDSPSKPPQAPLRPISFRKPRKMGDWKSTWRGSPCPRRAARP